MSVRDQKPLIMLRTLPQVLQEHKVLQAELRGLRERKELKEPREIKGLLEHKETKEPQDHKEIRDL
jgi:hypothetical protein